MEQLMPGMQENNRVTDINYEISDGPGFYLGLTLQSEELDELRVLITQH